MELSSSFSVDEKYFASVSSKDEVSIHDTEKGEQRTLSIKASDLSSSGSTVLAWAESKSSEQSILVGKSSGYISLWSTTNNKSIWASEAAAGVSALAYSSNSQRAFSASVDPAQKSSLVITSFSETLSEKTKKTPSKSIITKKEVIISASDTSCESVSPILAFSSDETQLVLAYGSQMHLLNTSTLVSDDIVSGIQAPINAAAFVPHAPYLLTAAVDSSKLSLWRLTPSSLPTTATTLTNTPITSTPATPTRAKKNGKNGKVVNATSPAPATLSTPTAAASSSLVVPSFSAIEKQPVAILEVEEPVVQLQCISVADSNAVATTIVGMRTTSGKVLVYRLSVDVKAVEGNKTPLTAVSGTPRSASKKKKRLSEVAQEVQTTEVVVASLVQLLNAQIEGSDVTSASIKDGHRQNNNNYSNSSESIVSFSFAQNKSAASSTTNPNAPPATSTTSAKEQSLHLVVARVSDVVSFDSVLVPLGGASSSSSSCSSSASSSSPLVVLLPRRLKASDPAALPSTAATNDPKATPSPVSKTAVVPPILPVIDDEDEIPVFPEGEASLGLRVQRVSVLFRRGGGKLKGGKNAEKSEEEEVENEEGEEEEKSGDDDDEDAVIQNANKDEEDENMRVKGERENLYSNNNNDNDNFISHSASLSESLSVLLTRALRSSDMALLERCFYLARHAKNEAKIGGGGGVESSLESDGRAIINRRGRQVGVTHRIDEAVAHIVSTDAVQLLRITVDRLLLKPAAVSQMTPWIQAILHFHSGHIMAIPKLQPVLGALSTAIDQRAQVQGTVLKVLGRLNVLLRSARDGEEEGSGAGDVGGGGKRSGGWLLDEREEEEEPEVEDAHAVLLGEDDDGEGMEGSEEGEEEEEDEEETEEEEDEEDEEESEK
eukprot:CAMPEP_0175074510 /NCGR_PEP_ID=MMETSP0052_2-20121109/21359_1 /TAXON_ID=51329 ORGANISM="Polytomella parva, Strain SAG 63-3" /NCGR_SAMPLE_ID=MMETSP0052_2 /ASSEMBLY_ACC=CAM_ASM_000194 /LENGTH=888 /DNA_ID=CAMNT_0016342841 /DNA_START=36 /DNA_END=2702 /DNA_ORIENTATION=-